MKVAASPAKCTVNSWKIKLTQYYEPLKSAGYDKKDLKNLEDLARNHDKFEEMCKKVQQISTSHILNEAILSGGIENWAYSKAFTCSSRYCVPMKCISLLCMGWTLRDTCAFTKLFMVDVSGGGAACAAQPFKST